MKAVGIIAEYNPFHLGHEYQIKQIRRQTGAEHIVVVMSGDFVQRGTPAWTDKFLRTQMALAGGADMVFELPVHFATASAENFAYGAVSLLHQLGFIDGLCFGSECGDLDALSAIARYLVEQEDLVQQKMQKQLSCGYTYPAARAELLVEAFPDLPAIYPDLLTGSNNILAIEYLKALYRLESSITPITIARQGSDYHDTTIEQNYPSASAIRSYYAKTNSLPTHGIPAQIRALLEQNPSRFPVTVDDLSDMLYYKLRSMDDSALSIMDVTHELWQRIQKQLPHFQTVSQFTERVKSRQYTQTRIQRVFLHLLLNLQPVSGYAAYARLLGLRHSHSSLLRRDRTIPIITKVADAVSTLSSHDAVTQLTADLYAHDLYRYLLHHKHPDVCLADDYHSSPHIV
ncbi:MAG: nucleotidyltransferase family protein [Lachnospiraceae bacterium]|nr:nucleotidyltransferase family protein [Lachnospiraceae bacterium]